MDASEMLRQQEAELQRIRNKRNRPRLSINKTKLRRILNIVFVVLAVVGLALYYFMPQHKDTGFVLILVGMGIKVLELLIRYLG